MPIHLVSDAAACIAAMDSKNSARKNAQAEYRNNG
jgi:hypothetical protein